MPPVITPSDPSKPRRSRPRQVADAIKTWVMEQGLTVGDRMPGELEMMTRFGMAKGTIREAMRILEAEGLIRTRTGPGGGAFLDRIGAERAQSLLGNYFYFNELTIGDIYELRLILEPEVASKLAGKLDDAQIAHLEKIMEAYAEPAKSADEERAQHVAALGFHAALAEMSDNRLLGFVVGFMAKILTDMTVFQKLYDPPNHALWSNGKQSQLDLLEALRVGDADTARAVMTEHMKAAWKLMEVQKAEVVARFIG